MSVSEGDIVVAVDRHGASTKLKMIKRLGRGREGAVFRAEQSQFTAPVAVKIFKPEICDKKIAKVRAMLEHDPERDASVRRLAWPEAVVFKDGLAIGYSMTLAEGNLLLDATAPLNRREVKSNLDYFSFHWLSENIAKTVSKLHSKNHIIGDFKEQNALFDPATLEVIFIDTDSYGISIQHTDGFPPDAITEEYSPPEYSPGVKPAIWHDLFSLAVFYHYLFFAVHPFSGATDDSRGDDGSIASAIKKGRWLYSKGPKPNPTDTPFYLVGPVPQALFRRAFQDGHRRPDMRPTAEEWEKGFREARYDLTWCDKHPLHVYDSHSSSCPWCQLKPERWTTIHRPQSVTRAVAIGELRQMTQGSALRQASFERAKRRLVANPGFRSSVPDVVDRLERYERRQAEIDQAITLLKEAESDDLKLIDIAERFTKDAELEQFARAANLGGLLDRAAELKGCLERLNAAVAAAPADRRGRFPLAGEEELLRRFAADARILERSSGLLSRFAGRRTDARERLEAARVLAAALRTSGQMGSPIVHLRDTLKSHQQRLAEVADDGVTGATGNVALAQRIIRFGDELDKQAAAPPDRQIVEYWDQHIAPLRASAPIVDAEREPEKPSLQEAVEEARKSMRALHKFEQLVQQRAAGPNEVPKRDRAIVAADPTPELSTRALAGFATSRAGQELAAASHRLNEAERFTKLANAPNPDESDPILAEAWEACAERASLDLSDETLAWIKTAVDRMARLDKVRPLASASPPEDEKLLAAFRKISPDGDLSGLEYRSGETLRARVELAQRRVDARDAVDRAIKAAPNAPLTLEGETEIATAWDGAEPFRADVPDLFAPYAPRASEAVRRLHCHSGLTAALAERHGSAVDAIVRRHRHEMADFPPVMERMQDVDRLLADYKQFQVLLEQAERHVDEEDLIGLSEKLSHVLELADADDIRPSLGNRSLTQLLDAIRLRDQLKGRLDAVAGVALDPAKGRARLAGIVDSLPTAEKDYEFGDAAGVYKTFAEAVRAAGDNGALTQAVEGGDFRSFFKLWDETWHPLFPSTRDLIAGARQLASNALAEVAPETAKAVRLSADRIALSWAWPLAQMAAKAGGGDSETMTIAIGDRHPPDGLADAEHVVTVFRRPGDKAGSVELTYDGDRLAAKLYAGCLVAGEPIRSGRRLVVLEEKRRLAYRFRAAGLRSHDDWLYLRAAGGLLTPALRVVHARTGQTVAVVGRQAIPDGEEVAVNLSPLLVDVPKLSRLFGGWHRIFYARSFVFVLEPDNPDDKAWLEIVHPSTSARKKLSIIVPDKGIKSGD